MFACPKCQPHGVFDGTCPRCNGTTLLTCSCGHCADGEAIGLSAITLEYETRACAKARAATPAEASAYRDACLAAACRYFPTETAPSTKPDAA